MYIMGTRSYLLWMFISQIILFYVFIEMYSKKIDTIKDKILIVSIFILSFIISSFIYEWVDFLIIFLLYLSLNKQKEFNHYLFENLIIACMVTFLVGIVVSTIVLTFMKSNILRGFPSALIYSVASIFIALIYIYLYKKMNIKKVLTNNSSIFLSILLSYLYLVMLSFMSFIQHFQAYKNLINGILIFLIVQIFLVTLLFIYDRENQKKLYEKKLSENQIKNIRIYTDKIENDYNNMRHFKHNYKNVLLSLREAIEKEDYTELSIAMDKLEEHSTRILDNKLGNLFKDLHNIKNSYLKSLYIEKLNEINQKNISCSFECIEDITNSSDNIFDIITILGISLDNAIESADTQESGKIQLAIFKKGNLIYYLIYNTVESEFTMNNIMNEGYTSKKNHTGLGLTSIEKIKSNHPEIVTTINVKNKWFKFQLTTPITKEAKK